MTRIILAEDHCLVRKGIKSLLTGETAIKIVAEASDGFEAAELTEKHNPDVLLLDLSMPRLHGLAVIRRVLSGTKTQVLVLTMHADGLNVREALSAGAMGYVLKDSSPDELVAAIHAVMRGEPFVSAKLRQTAMVAVFKPRASPIDPCDVLTARERLVLERAAEGLTNNEIGEKLFISSRTVESHRANLIKKLRLSNQTELVRFAVRHKIINA